MRILKGVGVALFISACVGLIIWAIADFDKNVVNRGLSKALSYSTEDHAGPPDANQLIKSMACEAMRPDGTRTCQIELNSSNDQYYVSKKCPPKNISKLISITVPDKGGIQSSFNYELDIDAIFVEERTPLAIGYRTASYLDHFEYEVDIRGILADPKIMPLDSVLTPLRQSLRNVSNAVMELPSAKEFGVALARVIQADVNLDSYR